MKTQMVYRLGTLATVAILAALIPTGTALADPSTCPDGNVCFWTQTDYNGMRVESTGFYGQWGEMNYTGSGKNRFNNRKVLIGNAVTGGINVLECLNPGDNDPNFPA